VPESGLAYVSDEEAAKRPPNALADNLRASLEKGPVKFRLLVQVAAADDSTADATKVWPDSRPTVELGEIAVIKALDAKKVENELLFLPTNVTGGRKLNSRSTTPHAEMAMLRDNGSGGGRRSISRNVLGERLEVCSID
jgi:catalase